MGYKGILVDVNYCTGCQACIVACQEEKGFSEDRYGIVLFHLGPLLIDEVNDKWEYDFFPQFTHWCDLCADRLEVKSKLGNLARPSCVQHCQAQCLEYGDVEELAKNMTATRQYVFSLQED